MLKFETQAAGLPYLTSGSGLRHNKIGLRGVDRSLFDRDLDAKRFRIQLNEHVALLNSIVVVHEDSRDLSADTRSDERDVAVDEGVVSRNGMPGVKRFRDYDEDQDDRADDDQGSSQSVFF